jgi:DNA-binding response OmpR family regulator
MNKILVVEDETLTQDMLRRFFEIVGYEVVRAVTGAEATRRAIDDQPSIIILDINLPDIDGYEVCRRLRAEAKTRHIPIIFLTTKDDRRDKLAGLELGADDFLTKPFDIEELRLRVHNIIQRTGGTALVDARTSLPSTSAIQERLPKLLEAAGSVFLDAEIEGLDTFAKRYGPVAANQAIRSTAKIIGDLLHEIDPLRSFIGHPADHRFLIGITRQGVKRVQTDLPERFKKLSAKFYDKAELERGMLLIDGKETPLMAIKLKRIARAAIKKELGAQVKTQPPGKN